MTGQLFITLQLNRRNSYYCPQKIHTGTVKLITLDNANTGGAVTSKSYN